MKRKLGCIFMTAGLLCITAALSLLVYNNNESKHAKENSAVLMDYIRTEISENVTEAIPVDPFEEEMKIEEIDGYGYIGYLSIPVLDIDLPVMADWDYNRLKISPCRYYGSTKTDNLVIAAHNYKYHFGYLGQLEVGDEIFFTDMDANLLHYKVTSVELLLPTDVDKIKEADDDLILYTCTYGGAKRITVRCSYKDN